MKTGQARVFSQADYDALVGVISEHRHPEKNRLIIELQFKLALRVQELSLLQIKEVAFLNPGLPDGFQIKELLQLPAAYTKGAGALRKKREAMQEGAITAQPSFTLKRHDFDVLVAKIAAAARQTDTNLNPADFYPAPTRKNKGVSRALPIIDRALIEALRDYLVLRLSNDPYCKSTDPLIVTQKGGPYSPNTLQEHVAMMMRGWAMLERGSSHSGRRTALTRLYKKTQDIKLTQLMAGHADAATTVIYTEATEVELKDALQKLDT